MKKLLHKIGFHFMRFHHGTANKYYQCSVCGKRTVWIDYGVYQPIDECWLNHEFTSISNPATINGVFLRCQNISEDTHLPVGDELLKEWMKPIDDLYNRKQQ